jgi:hypothetical protein
VYFKIYINEVTKNTDCFFPLIKTIFNKNVLETAAEKYKIKSNQLHESE